MEGCCTVAVICELCSLFPTLLQLSSWVRFSGALLQRVAVFEKLCCQTMLNFVWNKA